MPIPALVRSRNGRFLIFSGVLPNGDYRVVDAVSRIDRVAPLDNLMAELDPIAILLARKPFGAGANPRTFGFRWFLPSLARYRKAFAQVLVASLFIQIFALVTPLFFQIVVDKVLTHKGYSTTFRADRRSCHHRIVRRRPAISAHLRAFAYDQPHRRRTRHALFRHLVRLPIGYFETRAAGQTVARVRELETIRTFLTGQDCSRRSTSSSPACWWRSSSPIPGSSR